MISANKKIGDLSIADSIFFDCRSRPISSHGPLCGTKTSTAATTASFSSRWAQALEIRVIWVTAPLH